MANRRRDDEHPKMLSAWLIGVVMTNTLKFCLLAADERPAWLVGLVMMNAEN